MRKTITNSINSVDGFLDYLDNSEAIKMIAVNFLSYISGTVTMLICICIAANYVTFGQFVFEVPARMEAVCKSQPLNANYVSLCAARLQRMGKI